MLVKLESRLKYIKAMQEDGEHYPAKGTLAVIDGELDFTGTNGYIQFMKLALDYIPGVYAKQDPKWLKKLEELYAAAEKLQEDNVRFKGKTKEEFKAYCEQLSVLMNSEAKHLPAVSLDILTADDLVPFMEKHILKASGQAKGFLYEEEDLEEELARIRKEPVNRETLVKRGIAHDIMMSLSGLKIEKSTTETSISYYLRRPGYHEHAIDALNLLIQSAVYAVNCSSTKQGEAFSFDTQRIHNDLRLVESIMERAKYLV